MALTNKDIEKLSGIFATKDDLENLRSELRSELKNDFLTSQDIIIKKLEDIQLEQKMAYTQERRRDEKLENHETRIKKIEDKVLA